MKTYRLFISSPGDVRAEREIAARVIARAEAWFGRRVKLNGYFWEHEPMLVTRGDFQQQIPDPANFDLVVCILWSRLGSLLNPDQYRRPDGTPYSSGTEYEFEKAMEAFHFLGHPDLLVYRRTETPRFPPEPEDEELRLKAQWKALKDFHERWFKDAEQGTFKAGYVSYRDAGDFERNFEEHLKRLVIEYLEKAGESATIIRPQRWWKGSPYRGLRAFHFEHEPIFFGRTGACDEVRGALRTRWIEEKCPFVMIFGASGSGKSSLMRAGVLPWLVKPGIIDGIELWRRAHLRPAEHPGGLLSSLAHALVDPDALPELLSDGTEVEQLAEFLCDEPKILVGLIKGALSQAAAARQQQDDLARQPAARLALALDQLEEVFTFQERFSVEDRRRFFRAIAALARSGYVWIVATLRSDFYSRCEEVSELVELQKGRGQFQLLPPTEIELSQIIRYPAEAAGVAFEEDPIKGKLDELIARETQNQPGALPLLEYALEMLYQERHADDVLTHAEYDAIGRVTGAVAKKAEQTFAGLSVQGQESLDVVLRQLILLSEGNEEAPARRIAREEDLIREPGARELVTAFVEARLFTGDHDKAGHPTVTLAHEALLKAWGRAERWIASNRDYLRQRVRLAQALRTWEQHQRHDDYLLALGLPLTEAESMLAQYATTFDQEETAYIASSRIKARRAEQRRTRIRNAVLAGLSLLTVVAIVGFALAFFQKKKADKQKENAIAEKEQAQETLAQSDLLHAEALIEQDKLADAMPYLARSLRTQRLNNPAAALAFSYLPLLPAIQPTFQHQNAVSSASFSPDGKWVVTASFDHTARVWNARTCKPVTPWLQHQNFVHSASFSPDGKWVATASRDKTARVWDAQTGQPISAPLQHQDWVCSANFSPDGKSLVTASFDHTARVWDAQTGQPISSPLQHQDWVYFASFSPDGRWVVTASDDKTARVWDAKTGQPISPPLQHQRGVNFASFSPDGKWIVTASGDQTGRVWDALTGQPISPPLQHRSNVFTASFSPGGRWVVTASDDKTARVWDAKTGQPISPLLQHQRGVNFASFSPDGKWVVTASRDKTARVWDAKTGQPISPPLQHRSDVFTARFSPDGRWVVTASDDKTARVWDAKTGQSISSPLLTQDVVPSANVSTDGAVPLASDDGTAGVWPIQTGQPVFPSLQHREVVRFARFSPDGKWVVTASDDKTARVWDALTGQPISPPLVHRDIVRSANFSRDGKWVVTASDDKTARVWDALTGQPISPPLVHRDIVRSASFGRDGKWVVTASDDKTARVWDALTGQPISPPLVHQDVVRAANFRRDGKWIVTASNDNTARVWDVRTGQPISPPLQHQDRLTNVSFSPDGQWVVTASDDQTARVWDALTGQPISPPLQHQDIVTSASFSPDGQRVVTASWDQTARVWDARTGQPVSPPLQHQDRLTSAGFSRDGNRVVTASYDKTARVWDAKTGRPLSSPLQHQDTVYTPSFSLDGTRVLTASADHTARVWDIAPETASPDWLPDVLEAVAFQSLDDSGGFRPFWTEKYFQIRHERLVSTSNDPWDVFGRWLFSDPATRTISPWSPVTIPQYTQRLIVEGTLESLDQAQALSYGQPQVQAQIAAKRASLPPSTPTTTSR